MLSGWLQKEFCHLQIRLFSTEQSVQILSGQSPAHSWEVLEHLAPHLLLEDMRQAEGEQHCLLCPKECAGNC